MGSRRIEFVIAENPPKRLDKAVSRDVPEEAALSRTRLARLIEGESLLNDAAAIALFTLFAALLLPRAAEPVWGSLLAMFAGQLGLGAVAGFAIARVLVALMDILRGQRLAQVSMSIALPYITYIVADQVLGVSGVVAVVAAGMTVFAYTADVPTDRLRAAGAHHLFERMHDLPALLGLNTSTPITAPVA